jgi:PPP family 3-phenylpropionic acid transporter
LLTASLNLRLSGFYLLYFATLGVVLPYWSLYLQSLGFGPLQIGELIAINQATKVAAPNLWGWIADHTGQRIAIVRLACLATPICFLGVFLAADSFSGLAMVMLGFSFFWNAALPQFEVITLNHLEKEIHRYSRIRLWGSVGFVVTAVLVGTLIQRWGVSMVPAVLLSLFVALWLNSLTVPEKAAAYRYVKDESFSQVLFQPRVLVLLLICFVAQASHGPYYAFFSIYLEALGYSRSLIGGLWSLGVVAEVGIFLLVPRLLPNFGAQRLMLASLLLTTLRWLLIGGFAADLPLLLFAQTLHAFSFGMYHAVAIYLIHHFFTGPHQGRGQALYSSLSFGAGGALGSLAAGYLWSVLGPEQTYFLAAGLSAMGIAAIRGLRL